MVRLLHLRTLGKWCTGPRVPWAGMLPARCCMGRATPPATRLPPEPSRDSLSQSAPRGACRRAPAPHQWASTAGERLSHDTFVTMERLLQRSRSVGELLRWLSQNPGKVSASHYAVALHRLGHLLPQDRGGRRPAPLLEQLDFQVLSRAVASRCSTFDDASLVRCLHATAALGLPGDCPLVRALEEEAQRRLDLFSRKDLLMVFSSAMRLHPTGPTALVECCLGHLECQLEKEQHPQTLFLLLSYYRLRAQEPQGQRGAEEQVLNKRQALRLVRHMLGHLEAVREHELGLIDEMLAFCGQEAGNRALEAIFSAPLFYKNRQERFVHSMADWFPGRADGLTPPTMALVAKYLARHRLREPRLLDSIALFLLKRMEQLDSKMIQKLVFPFSRLNYRPSNYLELFPRLELVLEQKAGASPLAATNILMSLFQLQHFPTAVLRQVFSPAFLNSVTSIPCGWIMRRYLSLLDMAVALEVPEYEGPRLDPRYRVRMFGGALTADEANRKYSYKGLVGEALRQLVGKECYQQDEVLPPGYCIDFLLWISSARSAFPLSCVPGPCEAAATDALASEMPNLPRFGPELLDSPTAGAALLRGECPCPLAHCGLSKELSLGTSSLGSPTQTDPSPASSPSSDRSAAGSVTRFRFPTQGATPEQELLEDDPPVCSPLSKAEGAAPDGPQGAEEIHRVVLSVNDKWHYCQNSPILVGSRAMHHRHLRLLGYHLVQLPYTELESVSGIEEAKRYLCQKLRELRF